MSEIYRILKLYLCLNPIFGQRLMLESKSVSNLLCLSHKYWNVKNTPLKVYFIDSHGKQDTMKGHFKKEIVFIHK